MSVAATGLGTKVAVRSAPGGHRRRRTRFILPGYTFLLMLYLLVPIFLMILYGFNDIPGERQSPRFYGLTLEWYRGLFSRQPDLSRSVWNSLIIAVTAAGVATPLGTLLGLALGRYSFRGRGGVNFTIFMAIAVPEIVLGSSLLAMFVQVQAPLGLMSILLAHIGFTTPFVAVTVRARVAGLDVALEEAAKDLYATPPVAFLRVTLPMIAPGILAGFLLAFVLSLDDFVVTQFVSGQAVTFPLWVYGSTRIGMPPSVNVFGTLLFVGGVTLALLSALAGRHRRR
jgi:spermidine/putrescine transport system permease protein